MANHETFERLISGKKDTSANSVMEKGNDNSLLSSLHEAYVTKGKLNTTPIQQPTTQEPQTNNLVDNISTNLTKKQLHDQALANGGTYGNLNSTPSVLNAVSNGIDNVHQAIQNMPTNVPSYGNKYGTTLGIKTVDNAVSNLGDSAVNSVYNVASGLGRLANETILNKRNEIESILGKDKQLTRGISDEMRNIIAKGIVDNNNKVKERQNKQSEYNQQFQNNFASDGGKTAARIMNEVETSIGNMAPQIVGNMLTGGAIGMIPLFLGSYGGSLVDKTDEYGNVETKENVRALFGAGIEVFTEMLFGINRYFGGQEGWLSSGVKKVFGDKLIDFMGRKLGVTTSRFIYDQLENAVGEGLEEFIGTYMNAYVDNVLDNNNWNVMDIINDENKSEALYSGLIGGLTGIVMELPTARASYIQTGNEVQAEAEAQAQQEATDFAKNVVKNASQTVNDILANKETSVEPQNNVSNASINTNNNLYENIANNAQMAQNVGNFANNVQNNVDNLQNNVNYAENNVNTTQANVNANNSNINNARILSRQEAIDTGRVTPQEFDKLVNWSRQNGVEVRVVNAPGANYNGYYNDNMVTINLASQNKFADIWRHEMFHSVEDTQLGKDLANYVRQNYEKFGFSQEDVEFGERLIKDDNLASEQNIDNELVARFLEQYLQDDTSINEMAQTNPSLFQRIWNWIKEKLGLLKSEPMSEEQQILKNMNKMFENAVNNRLSAQNSQFESNSGQEQVFASKNLFNDFGGNVLGVQTLDDNSHVIKVNMHFTPEQMSPSEVYDYIIHELAGNTYETYDGVEIHISKTSAHEYAYGKNSGYKTSKSTTNMYKTDMALMIEEAIYYSQLYNQAPYILKEGDKYSINGYELARDGFDYRLVKLEDLDGNDVSFTLVIGKVNGEDGAVTHNFYDLINQKDGLETPEYVIERQKERSSGFADAGFNQPTDNTTASSRIIQQSNKNVNNTEFSKNFSKNYNEVNLPTTENATTFYRDILSQPDFKALAIYDNTLTSKKPIADLVNNPNNYSLEEAKRALTTIDKNATFDGLENYSEEEAKGAIIEAIKDSEYEGMDFNANDPNGERALTTVIVPSFEQNRPNSYQVSHFMTEQDRPVYHDVIDNTNESIQNSLEKILPVDDGNGYVARIYTDDTQFSKNVTSTDSEGTELTNWQQEHYSQMSQLLRDENGRIKPYFHGSQRVDRIGNYFDPNRATSGPMAYFTDDESIAKSYSRNKADTSLLDNESYDLYDNEYDLFSVNGMSLKDYWHTLPKSEQISITEKAKHITFDDEADGIIYDSNAKDGLGNFNYELKNNKGNALDALFESWITSGELFGKDMDRFQNEVLKLAGVNADYSNPFHTAKGVYKVYLNVTNPLDTKNVPTNVIDAFEDYIANNEITVDNNSKFKTKNSITPQEFIEKVKRSDGGWYFIPDWATNILKSMGYDGIVDVGGLNVGDTNHQVVIPFYSEQIKRVDNLNPTNSKDIRYSQGNTSFSGLIEEARRRYKNASANEKVTQDDTQVVKNSNIGILNKTKADELAKSLRIVAKDFGVKRIMKNTNLYSDIQALIEEAGNGGIQNETLQTYVQHLVERANFSEEARRSGYVTQDTQEIVNILRTTPIKNDSYLREGKNADDKQFAHGIKKSKNGVPIDSLMQEINDKYPGYFDIDVAPGDLYQQAVDLLDSYDGVSLDSAKASYLMDQFGVDDERQVASAYMDFLTANDDIMQYSKDNFEKRQEEYNKQQLRKQAIEKEKDIERGISEQARVNDIYQYGSEEDILRYEREQAKKLNKAYQKAIKNDNLREAIELKRKAIASAPREFGLNMTADAFTHLTDKTQKYLTKKIIEAEERGNKDFHTMAEDIRRTKVKDNLVNQNEWKVSKNEKLDEKLISLHTQERNAISLFGKKDGKWINDNFVNPVHEHEANSIRELNGIKERMGEDLQYVHDNYDTEVDSYLDGKLTEDELLKATNEKTVEIAKKMRQEYNDKYEEINKALIDAGLDPILYTMTYTPHLDDVQMTQSNLHDNLKRAFEKVGFSQENDAVNLSTINGVYEQQRKSTHPSFFALKSREGQAYTNRSATMKFESYMRNAEKVINHTQDVQNFKSLAEAISGRDQQAFDYQVHQLNDELQQNRIGSAEFTRRFNQLQADYNTSVFPVQSTWANRYSELLTTGTTKFINNALGGDIFSDKLKKSINTAQGHIARNMVAFNLSSAVNNLQPLIQAKGMITSKNLIRGMQESVSNTIQNDGYTYKSTFLTNLYGSDNFIDYGNGDSIVTYGFKLMDAVDKFTKPAIHRGFYYDAIERGMSEENAIKYADEHTSALVADRSYASMPEAFYSNSPLVKLATTFQLEQMNIMEWYTKDLPRFVSDDDKKKLVENLLRAIIGTSVAAWAYNYVFKQMFGYNSAFSPIDNAQDIYKELQSDDDIQDKAKEVVGIGVKDIPLVGTVYNNLADTKEKNGNLFPVQSALPNESNINHIVKAIENMSDENMTEQEKQDYWKDVAINDLSKALYLVPGGSQARKTIRGLDQYIDGVNDNYVRTSYTVEQNFNNLIRSIVGGQSAVAEAQDYWSRPYTKSYTQAQEIEKKYDFSTDEFYDLYDDVRKAKGIKVNGKTITNSSSLQKREIIDNAVKNTSLRKELYKAFDVSKTVQEYDYSTFMKEYNSKVRKNTK